MARTALHLAARLYLQTVDRSTYRMGHTDGYVAGYEHGFHDGLDMLPATEPTPAALDSNNPD